MSGMETTIDQAGQIRPHDGWIMFSIKDRRAGNEIILARNDGVFPWSAARSANHIGLLESSFAARDPVYNLIRSRRPQVSLKASCLVVAEVVSSSERNADLFSTTFIKM